VVHLVVVPVVVPVVHLEVVPVVHLEVVPVVDPAAVAAHHAVRDAVAVAARNSSQWTCRLTRRMTPPCPRARLWSSVPVLLRTSAQD